MRANLSKPIPHYLCTQRHFTHFKSGCCCSDHKRNTIVLILFLFLVPSFYLLGHSSIAFETGEDADACSRLMHIIYHSNRTLCSQEADLRGSHQRIIALSVFGPKENPLFTDEKFFQFIRPLLAEARLLFPSWTVRLYSDDLTISRLNLANLSRSTANLDVCNVNRLPVVGNMGEFLSGKLWRFLPALDPMVDFTSSRDLDSPLTKREKVVVEEFVNSPYLFLSMRDHPYHGIPILGGLWTAAQYRDRLLFLRLFGVLLDRNRAQEYSLARDQNLLRNLIWPHVKHRTLVYDSYTCRQFPDGIQRPYPTQRPSLDCHLGCVRPCCQNTSANALRKPCPKECRPETRPDWLYC